MRVWISVGFVLLSPVCVSAQSLGVDTGAAVEFLSKGGGADGGTNQAVEGYLEGEISGFYLGVWGQLNSQSISNEVDLYVGYRNELDSGFDYDLNYTRYYYPNDGGNCCGEIGLTLGQTIGDQFYVYAEGYWDPVAELGSAYIAGEFYPDDKITIDGSWGVYNVLDAENESEWEFGVTYALSDESAVDFRYYDGSDYAGYFGLTLSFDTSILGGGGIDAPDPDAPDETLRGDPRNRTY